MSNENIKEETTEQGEQIEEGEENLELKVKRLKTGVRAGIEAAGTRGCTISSGYISCCNCVVD